MTTTPPATVRPVVARRPRGRRRQPLPRRRRTSSTPRSAGSPLVDRAVDTALAAGIGPVVVVTGRPAATALHPSVVHVVNDALGRRPGDVAAARHRGGARARRRRRRRRARRPAVRTADAWRAVAARRRRRSSSPPTTAAAATRSGCAATCGRCCPTDGDEGARSPDAPSTRSRHEVPCDGSPIDIDTWRICSDGRKLVNEFTVNRPIDEAWAVITDVERIAPCLPGRPAAGDRGRRSTAAS